MTLMTKTAFARLIGVSPQAVDKKIRKGYLTTVGEGRKSKVDLDSISAKNWIKDRNGKIEPETQVEKNRETSPPEENNKPGTRKKEVKQKKKEKPAKKKDKKLYAQGELDLSSLPKNMNKLSKYDLDRIKQIESIKKERIKTEKERGQLIDIDLVRMVFGKIYEIDTNEFLQLSAKLADKICKSIFRNNDTAIYTEVTKEIDNQLYKVLDHIKITLNKFLEKHKKELIK